MTAGETKTRRGASSPRATQRPSSPARTATFTITLHGAQGAASCRALDDAFAAQISENATLEELRADLRRRLEAVAAGRGRRAAGNAVMTKLLAAPRLRAARIDGGARARPPGRGRRRRARPGRSAALEERARRCAAEAESRVKAGLLIESDRKGREDRRDARRPRRRTRSAVAPLRPAGRSNPQRAGQQRSVAHGRHRPEQDARLPHRQRRGRGDEETSAPTS